MLQTYLKLIAFVNHQRLGQRVLEVIKTCQRNVSIGEVMAVISYISLFPLKHYLRIRACDLHHSIILNLLNVHRGQNLHRTCMYTLIANLKNAVHKFASLLR